MESLKPRGRPRIHKKKLPPPAKICEGCGKPIKVRCRVDTIYCPDTKESCRAKVVWDTAKILRPVIFQSGVKGITYHRLSGKWVARAYIDKQWKYLGYFSTVREAVLFRDEVVKGLNKENPDSVLCNGLSNPHTNI